MNPPALDQHLRLLQRVEDLSAQEFIAQLAVEALHVWRHVEVDHAPAVVAQHDEAVEQAVAVQTTTTRLHHFTSFFLPQFVLFRM